MNEYQQVDRICATICVLHYSPTFCLSVVIIVFLLQSYLGKQKCKAAPTLRIAYVGCGNISSYHLEALKMVSQIIVHHATLTHLPFFILRQQWSFLGKYRWRFLWLWILRWLHATEWPKQSWKRLAGIKARCIYIYMCIYIYIYISSLQIYT